MKKKILMVTDVKGWGGYVRGQYIKKHLSDEFNFDLFDGGKFKKIYCLNNPDRCTSNEIHEYYPDDVRNRNTQERRIEFKEYCEFYKRFCRLESLDDYDLIYPLFHTMLLRRDIRNLLDQKYKIISIVTSYPTVRASFIQDGDDEIRSRNRFLHQAKRCAAILANNKKSLDDLRSIYEGKSFLAVRGVDEKVFYPTKGFTLKQEDQFTVAYCGKPVKEKGLEEIIRPACEEAGVNLITNTRNFTDALTQDEMREFYNKADVYVVASTIDGTPNPALEAAACGLTLLSNDIGNMPELIKHYKNGFMVKERKVENYVHFLLWMKKNQRRVWEIGQRGRKTILNEWTWDKVLNKNERNIFREVVYNS